MPPAARHWRPLIFACFFLSGASGLILEMVWTRQLTLVFGSTTLAISTVLTAFMGGLGLGSWLASRFGDRLRNPVRVYALAELAIGVYALGVPLVIKHYPGLNLWLWGTLGDRYALLSMLRFLASAGVLLLPTTLMGATLPILARAIVTRPFEVDGASLSLGRLYGTNLFGAVAGSFFAGFVSLPNFGIHVTNVVAACFNLTLSTAILVLGQRLGARPHRPSLDELGAELGTPTRVPVVPIPPRARRVVLGGFLVSGMTAMTLQVLWTRALAVVVGSSAFSFTLILLGFLIGLGAGSAVFGRIADRQSQPVRALGLLHFGVVGAIGLSYLVTDKLPYFFA